MRRLQTDVLVLGSGGAGLFAALHAHDTDPNLKITIAVKGLLGKCGCTRMVQGGYNVALAAADSPERHFMDTVEGGGWLNDQDLAWALVTEAPRRIRELENEIGCFFDRNPDGTIHQKAFAGQTFDRTVHKGDLTGIEIINRLAEQVWARNIGRLEEHRAIALIKTPGGDALSGVVMIDMRTGEFVFVQAKAVLLATGGGPTMYKYHTPSGDKSCDGMAMALRAGLKLRDMEMVQFHPTGLLAGENTRLTGTIIEEGLRGVGGHLLDAAGERFMPHYDKRADRATRDIVSRAMFDQMKHGKTGPNGGVFFTMRHVDSAMVRREFKGMVERCRDAGFDLVSGLVEVTPTAHYMMGGVVFAPDGTTPLPGLFAAGEDTGGVHGANRLGGNGVANSTVFGGLAGDTIGRWTKAEGRFREPDQAEIDRTVEFARRPLLHRRSADGIGEIESIRCTLYEAMWEDVGIVRDASSLARGTATLAELDAALDHAGLASDDLAFNLTWHDWLNLKNLVLVSRAIAAAAAAREDSRGAHWRADFPKTSDLASSRYTCVRLAGDDIDVSTEPVVFNRVRPGESLIRTAAE